MTNTKAKDNSSRDQDRYNNLIQEELSNMPSYVRDYQIESNHSTTTEYQYLTEFRRFFDWLRSAGISDAKDNKSISIDTLSSLRKKDMHIYVDYLKHTPNKQGKNNSHSTINRSLNALRSLFHYLTVEAEDDNGEPYFYRNVMQKVDSLKSGQTMNARARTIETKMYRGELKHDLISFIENDYINKCTRQGKVLFTKNKERDIAIIAFILGTGARRAEVANTDVKDIHLDQGLVDLLRKGGAWDTVPIATWTIPYIQSYLDIRKQRYNATEDDKALFLAEYNGKIKRITGDSITNLVKKYSTAFGRPTTPHKLRHTVASELFELDKDQVLVSQQLGQSGTSATDIYTHVDQKKQKDALSKLK